MLSGVLSGVLSADLAAQARLAELLAERVTWVTGGAEPDAAGAGTTVLVLVRSLSLADVVHGAREFAAGLDADEAAAWRRSWTRTRFLFGNPANLGPSSPARVVAPGGTAAWLGPFPDTRQPGLSRLLKPVTGRLPELPELPELHDDVEPDPAPPENAGNGRRRELAIAVGGLSLVDYLVHLHHTLAEAVLLGRLRPHEPLRLRHRRALAPDPTGPPPAYARVLPEPGDTGRLHLHTWLSRAWDA